MFIPRLFVPFHFRYIFFPPPPSTPPSHVNLHFTLHSLHSSVSFWFALKTYCFIVELLIVVFSSFSFFKNYFQIIAFQQYGIFSFLTQFYNLSYKYSCHFITFIMSYLFCFTPFSLYINLFFCSSKSFSFYNIHSYFVKAYNSVHHWFFLTHFSPHFYFIFTIFLKFNISLILIISFFSFIMFYSLPQHSQIDFFFNLHHNITHIPF